MAAIHVDPESSRNHYSEVRDNAQAKLADPNWSLSQKQREVYEKELADAQQKLANLSKMIGH